MSITGKETMILRAVLGRNEFIKLKQHIIEVDERIYDRLEKFMKYWVKGLMISEKICICQE